MLRNLVRQIFKKQDHRINPSPPEVSLISESLDSKKEHLEILYKGINLGSLDFYNLYQECLIKSKTPVADWKWYRRPQRALHLAQYFIKTMDIDAPKIECGVFRGFTSLMLCEIAAALNPNFTGQNIHLVDSFEGLSKPTTHDMVNNEIAGGNTGHFATPVEHVQSVLSAYPDIHIHKGWVPEVFAQLPESKWSFVHIDVDLYEPTLACLEYFFPRMAPGGVIINDDFDSPSFPGGGKSWREFCQTHGITYVALDTGQAVILID